MKRADAPFKQCYCVEQAFETQDIPAPCNLPLWIDYRVYHLSCPYIDTVSLITSHSNKICAQL